MSTRVSSDYDKDLNESKFADFWTDYLSDYGQIQVSHDDFLIEAPLDVQIDLKTKNLSWKRIENDRLNPGMIHVNHFGINRHFTKLCPICNKRHRALILAFFFADTYEKWFCAQVTPEWVTRPKHQMASYNDVDEKSSRQAVIYVGLSELTPLLSWFIDARERLTIEYALLEAERMRKRASKPVY